MIAGSLELQMLADVARLRQDMDKAVGIVNVAAQTMQRAIGDIKSAFAGLGAGLSVAALIDFTKNTIESAAKLRDLSVQAGITVEGLSALAAVGKATGTGADTIAAASNKLSKALATSNEESKGAATALKALGLSFDAFQKLTPDQRIQAIAGAMGTFNDGAQKSAASMLLFGKSGAEMLPFLKDLAQTGQLHAKITDEQAEAAHRFEIGMGKLRTQGDAWKKQLAMELLPTLDSVVQELLQIKSVMNDQDAGKSLLGVTLITVFQTVSSLGVNVVYVLRQMGIELGGLAAQSAAILSGDFTKAGFIRDQMLADAEAARRQVDQRTSNLLGITNSTAGAGRGSVNPPLIGAAPDFHKTLTGLEGDTKDKDGQNAYDALIKRVKERLAQQQEEVKAGRELTEQEKFDIKTRTDLAELMSKFPGLSKSTVDGLLAQSDARAKDVFALQAQRKIQQDLLDQSTQNQADMAAYNKARTDEAFRVDLANSQQRDALADSNELLKAEAGLLGATDQQRQITLDQLKIELDTKRKIAAIHEDTLLGPEERARATAAIQVNAELEKQQVALRAQIDDQVKGWQLVDSTAHDVFASIFDKGSDTFNKLRDVLKSTLVDMLYQMTVKQWIIQVAGSSTGGAIGSLAGGGGGGLGSLVGIGSSFLGGGSNSLGSIGSSLGLSSLVGGGGASAGALSASLAGGADGFAALGAAGGAAGAGGLMGGIGAGLAAIGPVGWVGLAALAAYSMFGGKGGGAKTSNGAGLGVQTTGDVASVSNAIKQIQAQYGGIVSGLGGTPGQLDLGIFSAQDPKGTALTQLQVNAALNGQSVYSRDARLGHNNIENVGRSDAELQAAMTEETERVVLSALQASNLTGAVGDYLKQLGDINKLSGGAVDASLTQAQAVATQQAQLQAQIFDLTATDAEKLTKQRQAETDAVDTLNKSMVERLHALQDEKKASDALADALAKAQSGVDDFNDFMRGITTNVHGYLDKLNATPAGLLSPEVQLANAKAQFDQQMHLAHMGDRTALSNITGTADTLISAQEGYSASGGDTAAVIQSIKTQLAQLPNLKSDAEMLADTITDSTKGLGDKLWDGLWGTAGMLATKFDGLDTNVDGLLSFAELKAAIGPLASDDTIRALMGKADTNADGLLSKEEAVRAGIFESTAAQTTVLTSTLGPTADASPQLRPDAQAAMAVLDQGYQGIAGSSPGNPLNPSQFAAGGVHTGGWRLVGERGPELEYTPPAQIFSNGDSRRMLSQADPAMLAKLEALNGQVLALTNLMASFARQNLDQGEVIAQTNVAMAQTARRDETKAQRL